MAFRDSARIGGATLAVLGAVVTLSSAQPASAQGLERELVGVHLGVRSSFVLKKYGNPNDVVIGDIGIRQSPPTGGAPTSGSGQGGAPSSPAPGGGGHGGGPGGPAGGGGTLPPPPGFGGSSSGGPGGGFGGGAPGGFGGPSGEGGMNNTSPGGFGGLGGGGGAAGNFGQTVSPLSNEQEVTWVYNRKNGNTVVSYEFLIGPNGEVTQIRVSGYSGGGAQTKRSIVLGSKYKDVILAYGQPDDHQQVGNVLVVSYKQKAHVSFQFLNQSGQIDAYHSGYKVIAITIAQID